MMPKLSDVCIKGTSNVAQKDLDARNGAYPIYGASGFIKNVDFYHQDKPYIAIVKDGAGVGRVMQLPAKSSVIGTMQYILPNDGVSVEYLAYALEHMNLAKYYLGAAIPHIYFKDYCSEPLPNHTPEEQANISHVLGLVSNLIFLRKQQLSKLDELVKSRFIELFGMPGSDDFGWGLMPLGSACHINPKKSQDGRLVSGLEVSFVPMPAVTECGEIDATTIKEYDEVKTGFTYFTENDVLFAKITPCMENGKGAVARGLYNGIGFGSTEFHVLRPISGKTNPYWLYMLTAFPQFREDAANNMTGSAGQRRVPASFLENYRVSVPPMELQEQFAAFVEQIDKSKFEIQKSLEKLEILKKSLMQQYFG